LQAKKLHLPLSGRVAQQLADRQKYINQQLASPGLLIERNLA
jgi:hypothetical protein